MLIHSASESGSLSNSRVLSYEERKRLRAESAIKAENKLFDIQELVIEPKKQKEKDVPEFNILILGEKESGKSLFISKMLSIKPNYSSFDEDQKNYGSYILRTPGYLVLEILNIFEFNGNKHLYPTAVDNMQILIFVLRANNMETEFDSFMRALTNLRDLKSLESKQLVLILNNQRAGTSIKGSESQSSTINEMNSDLNQIIATPPKSKDFSYYFDKIENLLAEFNSRIFTYEINVKLVKENEMKDIIYDIYQNSLILSRSVKKSSSSETPLEKKSTLSKGYVWKESSTYMKPHKEGSDICGRRSTGGSEDISGPMNRTGEKKKCPIF